MAFNKASGLPLLSVVVPIYFEQETIPEFYARTKAVLDGLKGQVDHELIYVNDGSTDKSLEMLTALAAADKNVKIINFSRNFGHQIAITAGIDAAKGDAVVVIDGDLQDPPETIVEMLAKWREGYKVVYGKRKSRKGENAAKLFTAYIYYRLINMLSDVDLPLDSGDFRLMDRLVVDALKTINEENRYIRGIISWIGFPQTGVEYERDARYAGVTKYNYSKMFKFAFDGITSFSSKPLRLSSKFGFLITFFSFLLILWQVAVKILYPETSSSGWTSIIVLILFLGGVQLISIGILGEYIGRIYAEVKKRPLYIISDKHGL